MQKIIVVAVLVVLFTYLTPWSKLIKSDSVTVTGDAKTTVKNQIANFSAGVSASNNNKETAVNEVNTKTTELIKAVKAFGIADKDIQTNNISVYEDKLSKVGTWNVNNSIEITLRNVDKAAGLVDVLNRSQANHVYGPNFRVDDTTEAENSLYDLAVKDARTKAELIAKASGRSLGKVIMVVDGGQVNNIYPMMAKADTSGGGAPVEQGSATVSKSMTVTFELK